MSHKAVHDKNPFLYSAMILYEILFVNPNIQSYIRLNGEKIMITQECVRMLIRSKVSMHVETVYLLNNRKADSHIKLSLDMNIMTS